MNEWIDFVSHYVVHAHCAALPGIARHPAIPSHRTAPPRAIRTLTPEEQQGLKVHTMEYADQGQGDVILGADNRVFSFAAWVMEHVYEQIGNLVDGKLVPLVPQPVATAQ